MIALSTTWGRVRFDSYPAMFLALRERIPAFEIASPPWPGHALPRKGVFTKTGVKGVALAWQPEEPAMENPADNGSSRDRALQRLLNAAREAGYAGLPRLSFQGGTVPLPGNGEDLREALRALADGNGEAEKAVGRAMALRYERAGTGLENLARTLYDLCRAQPDLLCCLETPVDPAGLPSPGELGLLFTEIRSRNLRYCHVGGRAAYLEAVAGWRQEAWIEEAGGSTAIVVLDDGGLAGSGHLPGEGAVAFPLLREQAPASAVGVLRPPGEASEDQVLAAHSFLEAQGFS
ncbi:MAG: hypothetical protein ACYTHM_14120 [Planctomycetota bacterium]|jgi:hypothetical protein